MSLCKTFNFMQIIIYQLDASTQGNFGLNQQTQTTQTYIVLANSR